jgi:hypothetical protein
LAANLNEQAGSVDYVMAGQPEAIAQQRQETGFQQAGFAVWTYNNPGNALGQVNVSANMVRYLNLPPVRTTAANHLGSTGQCTLPEVVQTWVGFLARLPVIQTYMEPIRTIAGLCISAQKHINRIQQRLT